MPDLRSGLQAKCSFRGGGRAEDGLYLYAGKDLGSTPLASLRTSHDSLLIIPGLHLGRPPKVILTRADLVGVAR